MRDWVSGMSVHVVSHPEVMTRQNNVVKDTRKEDLLEGDFKRIGDRNYEQRKRRLHG